MNSDFTVSVPRDKDGRLILRNDLREFDGPFEQSGFDGMLVLRVDVTYNGYTHPFPVLVAEDMLDNSYLEENIEGRKQDIVESFIQEPLWRSRG